MTENIVAGGTDEIRSREDLVRFLRDLHAKLSDGADPAWEDRTLPQYLEAAAAWIEDMPGYYENRGESPPDQPSWRTIAQIFAAARTYE